MMCRNEFLLRFCEVRAAAWCRFRRVALQQGPVPWGNPMSLSKEWLTAAHGHRTLTRAFSALSDGAKTWRVPGQTVFLDSGRGAVTHWLHLSGRCFTPSGLSVLPCFCSAVSTWHSWAQLGRTCFIMNSHTPASRVGLREALCARQESGRILQIHSCPSTGRGEQSKIFIQGFPGGTVVKNPPATAGDMGSSPGPGRSHMPRNS